jgi:glycosyltransferase involved in cell wall biosynthesis
MHHSPTTPSISIIVSAYNEEKYIENCLKHILADTYYVDEIIVIDNASTDQTNSIVQKFDRIKVFVEHRQ